MKNLPVPSGPRETVSPSWFVKTGPYAAIIALYRLIPARRRKNWNNGVSTSHEAMAAVLAPGGGRKAFVHYTTPQLNIRKRHGFVLSWMLFLVSVTLGLGLDKGQSWAN